MTNWKQAIYNLPPADVDVLVCYRGGHMNVSSARYYTDQEKEIFKEYAKDKTASACPGKFPEFGQNIYLNDPTVYWTELPEPPKERDSLNPITKAEQV